MKSILWRMISITKGLKCAKAVPRLFMIQRVAIVGVLSNSGLS